MKSPFLTLLFVALGVTVTTVHAATPPTPTLKKAEKPFIDLGNELGSSLPKTAQPKATSTNKSTNSKPVQTNLHNAPQTTNDTTHFKAPVTATAKEEAKPEHKAHWSYSGKQGPKYWGDLSAENIQCKMGKNQSPIDLRDKHATSTGGLAELEIRYRDVPLKIINNGHTIKVNYPLGSYIKLGNKRYELIQYHFHTPSEHKKEGFNYPMEMHLVHQDGDGNLAVIGIIFQEGEENEALQEILDNLPRKVNKQEIRRGVDLNPVMFFPGDTRFYKYSGSLTTPPCSEGVYWMVFKMPIDVSAEQIQQMNEVMGDNNRPVQEIHARDLLKSWSEQLEEPPMYEFY